MPPILALALCVAFTVWLLRTDLALRGPLPRSLWIPLAWLLIYSSRPVASWLGTGGASETDGNMIDAVIVFGLIVAAARVLHQRGFRFDTLISLNLVFFALLFYFAASILWAHLPFVAFKRWFKEFGHVLVVLVILTEANPADAIKALCVRLAILLFPLSVVLIKYFPEYGRSFSVGGYQMVTGVTTQKNSLGEICAIYGLVLLWDLVDNRRRFSAGTRWKILRPHLLLLAIAIWLLIWSDSKTSLLALSLGAGVFFCTNWPFFRRSAASWARFIFVGVVVSLLIAGFWTLAIAPLLQAVGRDATFTERTRIWESVLKQDIDPWIGCGFFSFWLEKGPSVWEDWGRFRPHSAHSGYLETYLDGGLVGCVLLGAFLLFTGWQVATRFSATSTYSRLLFSLMLMALVFNFSESYLFRLCPTWFFLVLVAIACHPSYFYQASAQTEASERIGEFEWIPERTI